MFGDYRSSETDCKIINSDAVFPSVIPAEYRFELFFKNFPQKLLFQQLSNVYYSALLNRVRGLLNPTLEKIGTIFASTGVSANGWTGLSFCALTLAGITYALTSSTAMSLLDLPVISSFLILIGGFFDIVDGSVARTTKHLSRKGSFLDSTGDRISESIIFIGIAVGNLAEPLWCMIALSLSFLVSYVRTKAESLGVELKGLGVGERAERLLILAIAGLMPIVNAMEWAVIIVSLVAACTLIHRIFVTSKKLSQLSSHTSI